MFNKEKGRKNDSDNEKRMQRYIIYENKSTVTFFVFLHRKCLRLSFVQIS